MKVNKGTRILVFTDGDDMMHRRRLRWKGRMPYSRWRGCSTGWCSCRQQTDANDLLRQGGAEAIHAIVAAVPAKLWVKGHYLKAARTPDDVWGISASGWRRRRERTDRVILDQERARLRQKNQPQEDTNPPGQHGMNHCGRHRSLTSQVLDSALNETKRYVFGHSAELAMVVVWCLLATSCTTASLHCRFAPGCHQGRRVPRGKTVAGSRGEHVPARGARRGAVERPSSSRG
jgi:hypothetical protein